MEKSLRRLAADELEFLRRYARQWSQGRRGSWVARNRATGFGVILAALGCAYGMGWREWSPLDAALLLYADMLAALLADGLKTLLAAPAVRRALAEDAEENHCWSILLGLRFRGIIEVEDIRRAKRARAAVFPGPEDWAPIEDSEFPGRSLTTVLTFAAVTLMLIGAGFWVGLKGADTAGIKALTDPGFLFWLTLAAAWRLGDGLFLIRRNLADGRRLDLVPGSGMGPGMVLIALPVIAAAAILTLPEHADAFWLTAVVSYVFVSLVTGGLLILFAWQRERWLAAFAAKDRRGELAALEEVLRGTDSDVAKTDQRTRDAYALMAERPDWVNGVIQAQTAVMRVVWVILAASALVLATISLAVALIWQQAAAWYIGAGFFAGALGTAGVWAWGRLQERRFGRSVLVLEDTPLRLGRAFRARLEVRIPSEWTGAREFGISLRCLRSQRRGMGENAKTSHRVPLWRDAWRQPALRGNDGVITGAVIERELPANHLESRFFDSAEAMDKVEWILQVEMEGPGMNYRARFELPVFQPYTDIRVKRTGEGSRP